MSTDPSSIPPVTLAPALLSELRAVVGPANLLTEDADRLAYGIDGTWVERLPQVVILPATEAEVAKIVKIAARVGIAITPRGNASGLSGGALPRAGIALALTRMNRIIEISRDDQVAVVEPGVITGELQRAVERIGLFYPPDPSSLSVSAIGGNIAENAGGARCLKYGVTGDYVMALRVVLPSGAVIRTGGRTVKNVTGYNLRALFVGSEGTLGIVTQATLRLLPKPRHTLTCAAHFMDIEAAAHATTAMLLSGIIPTTIELMDRTTIDCVEALLHLGLPNDTAALLLISVDGNHLDAVTDDLATLAEICQTTGATQVQRADTPEEAARLWQARRSVAPALARRRPNKLGEDIAVPRSQIPAMVRAVRAIAAEYQLLIPLYGHAGDGNLHPNILCDRRDAEEMTRVRGAAAAIFAAAVALGGTLSGEHGIGLLKKEFLESDLGPDQIALMPAIKATIDPTGIFNPGKIFPTGTAEWE
ncbi:MAG: FAD-binding protein [Ktedonobacterales bacterium]|nr:FAD-binding protein [Ktedonobacterales bacterium]